MRTSRRPSVSQRAAFRPRASENRRRGAILILIALLLIVFFGMVAFYVDVAYMQLCRTQLRIATDAAARASGESLSREQDLDKARQAARDMAAEHIVAGLPLELADSDIIPGRATMQSDGHWDFDPAGEPVNGLQITGRRTNDSPSGSIALFFGKIFNVTDYETSQQAVVVRMDRDICLVVDRSSSMKLYLNDKVPNMSTSDPRFKEPPRGVGKPQGHHQKSRWAALVDAVKVFNDALTSTEQQEYVALVSFSSDGYWAGVWNNASDIDQQLTSNPGLINAAMNKISARVFNGMTQISTGMDDAIALLTDPTRTRPFAAKTMIVLTDGNQNEGRPVLSAAEDAAAAGITVHTITFGDKSAIDETEMQNVAEAGGGNYYHAPDEAALKAAFREIALTLPVLLTE
jgi:Ca-activated chloride channel homolog